MLVVVFFAKIRIKNSKLWLHVFIKNSLAFTYITFIYIYTYINIHISLKTHILPSKVIL